MATTGGFRIVRESEIERSGRWGLVRRSLGLSSFGMNIVEIAPGDQIPEHDETTRDQEEVYVVLEGDAVVVIDGKEHPAPAVTFARVAPQPRRTIRNVGTAPVKVLMTSAPRSSGYEPMEWA